MILYPADWNFIACNPATVTLFGARDESHFTSLGHGDVSHEYQPDGELSMVKARKAIEAAMREGFHLFEWMQTSRRAEFFDNRSINPHHPPRRRGATSDRPWHYSERARLAYLVRDGVPIMLIDEARELGAEE